VELRTLRYFVTIAETGSVTAAAAALHLTQPSMSRQVRHLERRLGMDLFVRDEGRLRLTAAGRAFRPTAERLLAQAERALEAAAEIAAGRLEHLRITAPGTTLTDVVAPFLATLRPDDPMPGVQAEGPLSVYAALGREADLAIGTAPWPAPLDGLPLADLPVWAYMPADHRLAGLEAVEIQDLLGETLLIQTRDHHPRRALDEAVARARLAYGKFHEFTSAEVAQAVAAAGRGIAVVSDDARFGLRPLPITGPVGTVRISLYAAWERSHHAAATIHSIAERLAAFCVSRYGDQVAPGRSG
jgi:DNA-binding transcriptional LysR family regulator